MRSKRGCSWWRPAASIGRELEGLLMGARIARA